MSFMCEFGSDIAEVAIARGAEMGVLRGSFTKGAGNVVGFIGELCMNQFFLSQGVRSRIFDDYNFDILAGTPEKKIEVKSMKVRYRPQGAYLNSVSTRNAEQKADFYVFVRVIFNDAHDATKGGKAYFCGAVPCRQLKTRGRFYKTGEMANGYPTRQDSWCIAIDKSIRFDVFRSVLATAGEANQVPSSAGNSSSAGNASAAQSEEDETDAGLCDFAGTKIVGEQNTETPNSSTRATLPILPLTKTAKAAKTANAGTKTAKAAKANAAKTNAGTRTKAKKALLQPKPAWFGPCRCRGVLKCYACVQQKMHEGAS